MVFNPTQVCDMLYVYMCTVKKRDMHLFLMRIFLAGLFVQSKQMCLWGLIDEQDKPQLKDIQKQRHEDLPTTFLL